MTHAEVEAVVDAAAEDVWDCFVGSRGEELAIGVYAESVSSTGKGVGMLRTSVLLGGIGVIRERIEEWDPERFVCAYRLVERGPMPFADHRGRITLTPLGPARCHVRLEADFRAVDMSEAEAVAMYQANNTAGIARMKQFLGIG